MPFRETDGYFKGYAERRQRTCRVRVTARPDTAGPALAGVSQAAVYMIVCPAARHFPPPPDRGERGGTRNGGNRGTWPTPARRSSSWKTTRTTGPSTVPFWSTSD